ncbi:Gfo/Idh/MocA family protein [Candidatus Uabimicrobium sp. HlEnr_7]|uniref:Gfo/Idh/MocA family protein n=1 Tax=Candidatus Uabimicrobium helgolandensis TaxID=3095367 RepID=UPI003555CF03
MIKNTYNWGIVGLGNIAHLFAQGLKHIPQARLCAVASLSLDRAKKFAIKYDVPHYYGSYEEITSNPEIDIVYVATPHHLHCEVSLMCMRKHISVLCEKPLAINTEQVEEMIDTAREKHVFFMEALWSRFLPHICKIKELVDNGTLGDIHLLEADFGFRAPFEPQKRLFNNKLGGGSLLDIGIYPVFLSYLLLGIPKEIQALAKIGSTNVDESCIINMSYDSGALATLHSSITSKTKTRASLYGKDGELDILSPWYAPSHFVFKKYQDKSKEEFRFNYDNIGNGYTFEIIEAMKCMERTQQQSSLWNWQNSLELVKILDDIRDSCGIEYNPTVSS